MRKLRKTNEQFKKEVYNLVKDDYTFLEEYKGSSTKIKLRHNVCGHIWYVTPNRFLFKTRCPRCKASKGEEAISKFLTESSVEFEIQKNFKGLYYKNPLYFDFYLPEYNMVIEYDGEHHFRPVDFSGNNEARAKKNFEDTKKRDRIKEKYCKEKGMELIRIPYTAFDEIEKILNRKISKEQYEGTPSNMKPFVPSLVNKYEREKYNHDVGEDESCATGACPIR